MAIFGENKETDPEVEESPSVKNEVKTSPAVRPHEYVEVKVLTFDIFDEPDCWLVYEVDNPGNVYYVPVRELQHSWAVQKVSKRTTEKASKPYDFSDEIREFTVTPDQIRLGLYKSGLVNKREDFNFKKFLAALLQSGILPIKE